MNPAPVLRLRGRVHAAPRLNPVQPVPARAEQRDETGRVVRSALPERPGYDKYDVTILTEAGGFATMVMLLPAIEEAGGYQPNLGDEVDLPVRAYTTWRGNEGQKYSAVGFSFAGDVFAAEQRASSGQRVAAVS